jgi:hypothetical protein
MEGAIMSKRDEYDRLPSFRANVETAPGLPL